MQVMVSGKHFGSWEYSYLFDTKERQQVTVRVFVTIQVVLSYQIFQMAL